MATEILSSPIDDEPAWLSVVVLNSLEKERMWVTLLEALPGGGGGGGGGEGGGGGGA